MLSEIQKARAVKKRYEARWLKIKGVRAIGIGMINEETTIIISVSNHFTLVKKKIPVSIEGIPVHILLTDEFEAL